ncbi:DUF7146 domain-containing protein [Acidibrevibacterium fodinaquatile]|uniref:DUF7146 domain-containing protein n=1 Tax=Acidibrevibacterium fodinaquatile TaxID=1969806 RepID=UPI000E0DFF02|nr:toprim domain-containing protein [Acidibrevibacterium fodinaquatile]
MASHLYHPHLAPATEIAQRLGLRRSRPGEWRGQCPSCHYAGAAVLSERAGLPLLWCASCQNSAALAAALRSAAGGTLPAPRAERLPRLDRGDPAARLARAKAIWDGGERIEAGSPAAKYLELRRISHVIRSPALRWRADTPHPSGGRRIALVARIDAPDGKFAAIQRVFLKQHGTKADVEPQKASLGTIAGGAVRLQSCSDAVVIGEGIESAAAAGAILGLPAWAAVSAGNMAKSLILPPEIRSVVIAADNDPVGLRAAEAAWRRWRAEGRSVRIVKPNQKDGDFNDLQRDAAREIEQ